MRDDLSPQEKSGQPADQSKPQGHFQSSTVQPVHVPETVFAPKQIEFKVINSSDSLQPSDLWMNEIETP